MVFIHRSIKTRIETEGNKIIAYNEVKKFLYIDPLKQGLKQNWTCEKNN